MSHWRKTAGCQTVRQYGAGQIERQDKSCLLIGFDSEWETANTGRKMLSWQFALVDGDDLAEYVFLKNGDKDLSLYDAIGCILDHLESCNPIDVRIIRRYKYCDQWIDNNPLETVTDRLEDARSHCVYVYRPKTGFTMERIAGKCKWINAHNTSIRKIKPDNWKNANRPERQANILPFEMIREKLEELQNA